LLEPSAFRVVFQEAYLSAIRPWSLSKPSPDLMRLPSTGSATWDSEAILGVSVLSLLEHAAMQRAVASSGRWRVAILMERRTVAGRGREGNAENAGKSANTGLPREIGLMGHRPRPA